jgi:hypothetical protein
MRSCNFPNVVFGVVIIVVKVRITVVSAGQRKLSQGPANAISCAHLDARQRAPMDYASAQPIVNQRLSFFVVSCDLLLQSCHMKRGEMVAMSYRRIAADRRNFVEQLIGAGDRLAAILARNARMRVVSDAAREQEADAREVWLTVRRNVREWCERCERVDALREKRLAARERYVNDEVYREGVRVRARLRAQRARQALANKGQTST